MRWWPSRRIPQEPAWMHCGCEMRITHWLVLANEQTDVEAMRRCVVAALVLVRNAHHRRLYGEVVNR